MPFTNRTNSKRQQALHGIYFITEICYFSDLDAAHILLSPNPNMKFSVTVIFDNFQRKLPEQQ